MRNNGSFVLIVISILAVTAMAPVFALDDTPENVRATAIGTDEFDNYVLDTTADDLTSRGYKYGDYVDICSNGKTHTAIYLPTVIGCVIYEMGICGMGDDGLKLFVYSYQISVIVPLDLGDSIVIKYHGKSDRLNEYPHIFEGLLEKPMQGQSAADYANLRLITLNNYGLYRCSLPMFFLFTEERQHVIDTAIAGTDISLMLNISQSEEELAAVITEYRGEGIIDNYVKMYDQGKVMAMYCGADTITYATDLHVPIKTILDNKDKVICEQCYLGQDRTGLLFMLFECIAGWSLNDIANDYCKSFVNLYGVPPDSKEYELIRESYFKRTFYIMANPQEVTHVTDIDWKKVDISTIDAHSAAKNYFISYVGLSTSEYDELESLLT